MRKPIHRTKVWRRFKKSVEADARQIQKRRGYTAKDMKQGLYWVLNEVLRAHAHIVIECKLSGEGEPRATRPYLDSLFMEIRG